jgi:hypothetical protein
MKSDPTIGSFRRHSAADGGAGTNALFDAESNDGLINGIPPCRETSTSSNAKQPGES